MDVQLKELLEKIKDQGIREADAQADQIIAEAHQKAEGILSEARAEAERMRQEAREAADRFESTGRQAVAQAGRDLLLRLRASILALFDALIRRQSAEALEPQLLQRIIENLVTAWVQQGKGDFAILLSQDDQEACAAYFERRLADELKRGVEIKPLPGISAGFRVLEKDGAAYYDFTDQGLSELLAEFLNPLVEGLDFLLRLLVHR